MRTYLPLLALSMFACNPDISISPDNKPIEEPEDTDVGIPALQPDIQVTPDTLLFGALPLQCPSEDQEVLIENVGEAPLDVTSIELKGPGRITFSHDGGPMTIDPGESAIVTVGFTPADYLIYDRAMVEIVSNDPDEEFVDVGLAGEGSEVAYREELFLQEQASEVDVLFSIDYSGSMSSEIRQLGNTFNAFIAAFVNLGLDYHVGVITADPSCAELAGDVITPDTPNQIQEFIDQTSAGACYDEAAFGASKAALTAPLLNNQNAGFVRPNATLAVVGISDEKEQSGISAQNYANWLASMKGGDMSKVSFSGMVGPPTGGLFTCGGETEAAPKYHEAIRRTGGVWGDLCNLDMAPFLTHLSYVAAGLEFRFPLTADPASVSPALLTVTVNGVEVPYGVLDGWTYDADANSIEMHGSSIPDPGATIVVRYPFDSGC